MECTILRMFCISTIMYSMKLDILPKQLMWNCWCIQGICWKFMSSSMNVVQISIYDILYLIFDTYFIDDYLKCYYSDDEHHLCYRTDSRFAPSQWEMALLCNDISHWLGASLESALCYVMDFREKKPSHNDYTFAWFHLFDTHPRQK